MKRHCTKIFSPLGPWSKIFSDNATGGICFCLTTVSIVAVACSVADPERVDAHPDPTFQADAREKFFSSKSSFFKSP